MEANKEDKKCCTVTGSSREGTSLLSRFLPVLDPVNAPLDPRGPEDILVFAKHYAELVRYYDMDDTIDCVSFKDETILPPALNSNDQQRSLVHKKDQNKQVVNWKEFFYSDIAVVVASVSRYENRLELIKAEYNSLRKKTETVPVKENYRNIFLYIIHALKRINRWYERSVDGHPLKTELEVKIKSFLAPALEKLMAYDQAMILNTRDDLDLVTKYEIFKKEPWKRDFSKIPPDDSVYVGDQLWKQITYALMYVDDVFNSMYKVYEEITHRSRYYWEQAIENYPLHKPHMALFISFVELFSYARNEMNGLTKRHLEFFYRDVLHLKEKGPHADSVYLIYQLAKGVDDFELKSGKELTAGKDAIGKQLIYKTDGDFVINKAKVKELKTLYLEKGSPIKNIYAAPVANSVDGKGEKFKDPETAWSTFGYFEMQDDGKITGEVPEIGFAIASSQLSLSGGERKINFNITDSTDTALDVVASFDIFLTGEKGWQPLKLNPTASADAYDYLVPVSQKAIISFDPKIHEGNFSTTYPVAKFILKKNSETDPLNYEKLKLTKIKSISIDVDVTGLTDIVIENDDGPLNPAKPFYPFTARPLIGSGLYIGAKEFMGKNIETLSANIEYNGNMDFDNRYLGYVDFSASQDVPVGEEITNKYRDFHRYNASVKKFSGNDWLDSTGESVNLFSNDQGNGVTNWNIRTLSQENIVGKDGPTRVPDNETNIKNYYPEATHDNNYKIFKLVLKNDFGHDLYPTATALFLARRQTISLENNTEDKKQLKDTKEVKKVKDTKGVLSNYNINVAATDGSDIFVPSPPAEFKVTTISLNYSSTKIITYQDGELFHIYPFGQCPVFFSGYVDFVKLTDPKVKPVFDSLLDNETRTNQLIIPTNSLLPQFKAETDQSINDRIKALNVEVLKKHQEFTSRNYFQVNQYESAEDQQGSLYIGIEDLVPPQNLSLLFKFADGTAYDNDNDPPNITWSYLVNNEWIALPDGHLVKDGTYGFQTTGIILIDFPADATNNNTILTKGLHWLCASITDGGNKIPKLIDIVAQASQATFSDQGNDPAHYINPLPENSISKPLVKIPEIKTITQPFESFNGKSGEAGNIFYQRVSEQLRHKGRAITSSDYEHLVLEAFPSVYKVKILSHTDPDCLCRTSKTGSKDECCCPQVAPGHVFVIPVSNLRNKNAIDPLRPRTGRRTLLQIQEFLKKRVSPFVHIHVRNPQFEEVKVSFKVKFYSGVDKGFHWRKLNEDIIRHLTPWYYDNNVEILFGNKIYASKIINFIEELDYVDYITCFRMIHISKGCCEDSLDDLSCEDMQADLKMWDEYNKKVEAAKEANDKDELELLAKYYTDNKVELDKLKGIRDRLINEVSASSSQAILVSAKHHCISFIEEEPVTGDCHCKPANGTA